MNQGWLSLRFTIEGAMQFFRSGDNMFGQMEAYSQKGDGLFVFHTLRLTDQANAMRSALCRSFEKIVPAIASLEDLKAAQKEGLSFCAMPYLSSKAETTVPEDALCRIWALAGRMNSGATERGGWGVACATDGRGKGERSGRLLRGQCNALKASTSPRIPRLLSRENLEGLGYGL